MITTKGSLAVAAGIAGAAFLGYCVYFDKKRRSDPQFKQKLKARRERSRAGAKTSSSNIELPDMRNPEAVQQFLFEQVQKGEECMQIGESEEGVKHLAMAVLVCGQPQQLLSLFKNQLQPQEYQMLIQRIAVIQGEVGGKGAPPPPQAYTDADGLD